MDRETAAECMHHSTVMCLYLQIYHNSLSLAASLEIVAIACTAIDCSVFKSVIANQLIS